MVSSGEAFPMSDVRKEVIYNGITHINYVALQYKQLSVDSSLHVLFTNGAAYFIEARSSTYVYCSACIPPSLSMVATVPSSSMF